MRQVIVLRTFNRASYLIQVLASWQAARGIEDCFVLFRCEPGFPEVVAICESWRASESMVSVNETRLGGPLNGRESMRAGMEHDDWVIFAEDDIVVSTDLLEYFAWARTTLRGDPRLLLVCSNQFEERPGGLATVYKQSRFWSRVWATWRERWEDPLRDTWDVNYQNGGYDHNIQNNLVKGRG